MKRLRNKVSEMEVEVRKVRRMALSRRMISRSRVWRCMVRSTSRDMLRSSSTMERSYRAMATKAMETMPTQRRLKVMQIRFRFAELLAALSVDP